VQLFSGQPSGRAYNAAMKIMFRVWVALVNLALLPVDAWLILGNVTLWPLVVALLHLEVSAIVIGTCRRLSRRQ